MLRSIRCGFALLAVGVAGAAFASSNGLVISQIYGGSGSSGVYKSDFIEVFNGGSGPVDLSSYSVQYASATGTGNFAVAATLSGTLAAGQYYLVGLVSPSGAAGTALPAPDKSGGTDLSGTNGKVILASTTSALACNGSSTACTSAQTAQIVDLVGYGNANFYEGSAAAPVLSSTTAALRKNGGCTDTNNNSSDVTTGTPAPRNTASTANQCATAASPSVSLSVSPISFAENGGSATVTATLSAAAATTVTVNLGFSGTATFGTDYSASASSISIAAGSTSGSIVLTAIDDSTYEGNETIVTTISGTSANATSGSPNSATATIIDDDPMPPPTIGARIYQIQGRSHVSPMNGSSVSNVPGIVTAVASNGFYMQDGDGDGDVATSDGILVFTSTAPTVTVGQEVLVSGTVSEFRPSSLATNLSTTQIVSPTITSASNLFTNNSITPTVIGSGGRLPPTTVIDDDTKGNVETSTTRTFDPANEGIDFYESLEGMLVTINNPVSTDRTPAATGAATIWVIGDSGSNATGVNARGGVTLRELNPSTPGGPVDYNPEHIQLYTGLPNTNPGSGFSLNVGDQLKSISGVVSYYGGNYEILPTTTPALVTPASTTRGVSSLTTGAGVLSVGGYNVENLTVGDPQSKFDGLAADIVVSMGAPDILSVSEVQDNNGTTDGNVVACDQTMAKLLAAINAKAGSAYNYQYRQIDPVDNMDGGAPVGNIRVVQIFNANRVTFDDHVADTGANLSTTPVAVSADGNGKPTVNYSPGRIDPTNCAWAKSASTPAATACPSNGYSASRKPLVGEYTFNGTRVFIVSNHFTSRLGDDPLFGVNQPPLVQSEAQRRDQALIVHNFVKAVLAIDANAKVVVLGDFNEYDFNAPLRILRDGPLTANGGEGSETVLKNLSTQLLTDVERYSYVYNGNSQELDHIFVTPALLTGATQYQAVHLNAGYATQNSDHDPIVSSFSIPVCTAGTLAFSAGSYSVGEAGGSVTITAQRSGGSCGAVSASYATADGSAGSADYTAASGTLTWADGDTADKTFKVAITNDSVSEPNETFGVNLSNASGGAALGSNASATVTIVDDDAAPTVRFSTTSSRYSESAGMVTVTVQLVGNLSSRDVLVPITVGGTATRGASGDYTLSGLDSMDRLTIPAGGNSAAITVSITDDTTYEPDETVILSIGSGVMNASADSSQQTHTLTIVDNDQDTTPDSFSFIVRNNVAPGSTVTSEAVTINGFDGTLGVSVSNGGLCSVNGAAYAASCSITAGQNLSVRHTAASQINTTKDSVVTVGNTSATFESQTSTVDSVPDAFSFGTKSNVDPGTVVASDPITLSGYNTAAVIQATSAGFEYSVNGGPWSTAQGSLPVGASLQVRQTSNSASLGYTKNTLRVGGVDGSFTTRTRKTP